MQVFLEEDVENFKTRFIQLLCGYLEIEERNLGKVIYANQKTKEAFSFPGLPFYIPKPLCTTEKSLHTDELEIAKAITRETLTDGFFYGISNEEKQQTDSFLNHIVKDLNYDVQKLLPELNENLKFSTFINDKYSIGICDLFCFSLIISEFNKENDDIKFKYANVSRWSNYIENLHGISNVCKKIGLWFNLPYTPFVLDLSKFEQKTEDKKENKKEEEKVEDKKEEKAEEKKEEKKENKKSEKKKDKKEEKKEDKKDGKKVGADLMSKLDIKVGKIVDIEPNKEGDKLYNEQIDVGNGEIRKIASGLRGLVDINDLKDSLVVCILNLKPRNLKGWTSHGMILCVSKDGKTEPLRPPEGSAPGDLVYIGELPREPATDKKCPWDKVCHNLFVNDKKEATYKDDEQELVWHTDKGNIVSTNIVGGTIS